MHALNTNKPPADMIWLFCSRCRYKIWRGGRSLSLHCTWLDGSTPPAALMPEHFSDGPHRSYTIMTGTNIKLWIIGIIFSASFGQMVFYCVEGTNDEEWEQWLWDTFVEHSRRAFRWIPVSSFINYLLLYFLINCFFNYLFFIYAFLNEFTPIYQG